MPEETTKYQKEWDELRRRRKNAIIVALIIFPLLAGLIAISRTYPGVGDKINSVAPFIVVPIWLIALIFSLLGKHWKCPRCGNDYHYHYGVNVWRHRRACRSCKLPLYYGSSKFYSYWGRDQGLDIARRIGMERSNPIMMVKVLFFGATAEVAGKREVELSFDRSVNVREAFADILEKFPALNHHKLLFARNQEYVNGPEMVEDGDELAVFTAVSGG